MYHQNHSKKACTRFVAGALVAFAATTHFSPVETWAQCLPTVRAEIDEVTIHNIGTGDFLGYSVAMDGETAVVASPWANRASPAVSDAGTVRAFIRSGSTWAQQGIPLFASDAGNADLMGWDVDISGNRIVAAAVNEQAIYVFTRVGSTWSQTAKIVSPEAPLNNGFGRSVAIDGDTIVAGAPFDSVDNDSAGAMYIIVFNGTSWVSQAKVRPADTVMFGLQQMGICVAIDGDTAVAGAPPGSSGKAAYVFVRSGTTWSQQAKLTPSVANGFGDAVAIHGDRIIVGAPTDSGGGGSNGSVFFFKRTGSTWSEEDKFPGLAGSDRFGHAVDIYGDTAIVGDPLTENSGVSQAGTASILINAGGNWMYQGVVSETEDIDASDQFGTSVAIYGDSAVVGAPSDNWTNLVGTTSNDTGAATFYDIRCEGACCVNGNCVITSVGDCDAFGGVFQGLNTLCAGVTCDPGCCPGDMNSDQTIDALDVQGLVDALLQGEFCP